MVGQLRVCLITVLAFCSTAQELPDVKASDSLQAEVEMLRLELKAQKAQLEKEHMLLEEQQTLLASVVAASSELHAGRYLQASGWVTWKDFNKTVEDLKAIDTSQSGAMNSMWLLLCGALVMFMHAGFAMLETGCCRAKNAQNVLMKNLVNVCVGTLGWWLFGWAFAYGGPYNADDDLENGFIGSAQFAGSGFVSYLPDGGIEPVYNDDSQSTMLAWFFQWAFCTAGATIVSGGVAERVKSPTYAAYAFCMTSFIYPVIVAWTWGYGWLASVLGVGTMDFAGSGIVHLTGGVSALAGTVVLGPRSGRFDQTRADEFEAHNLPLVVLGTFALWFGWYGFNPGSTLSMSSMETGALAAQVAMNTTLAAATAGITVFLLRYALVRKYDVGGLCNGILAGLVSITAGCGNMESGSAFATGLLGAFVYQGASMLLVKLHIDDPVDASPVHGACGIWGVIAAGLFDWGQGVDHFHGWSGFDCMLDEDGSCQTAVGGTAIGAQCILVLAVVAWAGTLSTLAFITLKLTGFLRIDEETEQEGLDSRQHSPPKAYSLSGSPSNENSPPKEALQGEKCASTEI
eukprot:TRINITY_DN11322_c0_g1_i2.p1 TRINITY_DN11322_c0_g1~~TRINITY_DN11322_c0_g1_i2.p1  ORF type:complete len:573 (-),score=134.54 TRINITY_DN11322_c0_g1_i2:169-1887(-)